MGYTSDVAFILKFEITEQFHDYIQRYDNDDKSVAELMNECKQTVKSDSGDILYYWEFIKCSSGNAAVFVIERFIDQLDIEDKSDKYLFIRMGEEWDDIEERGYFGDRYGNNVFLIEVVREIIFWQKS
ncbi:MAG TPA: hypothetical protein DCL61_04395 [Cyanobacteria bacterium UBA12227]|nr:hypothetical protein [Cyanobacteria bacterium UBA12227]HAX87337.1 hypothetical protein [Cyanobacteria bacterium UBA11370]HBY79974.1 hypothetical protein [Cyanobacteria bacterium UBA11148]